MDARTDDRYCLAVEDIPDLVHSVEAGTDVDNLGTPDQLYSFAGSQLGIADVYTASVIRNARRVGSVLRTAQYEDVSQRLRIESWNESTVWKLHHGRGSCDHCIRNSTLCPTDIVMLSRGTGQQLSFGMALGASC